MNRSPWPDTDLQKTMLDDAEYLTSRIIDTPAQDAACHIKSLLARISELEAEVEVDDRLLESRNRFIASLEKLVGECPQHGAGCMPHVLQRVADLKDRNRVGGQMQERCEELAAQKEHWKEQIRYAIEQSKRALEVLNGEQKG